ncbi:uncharacterized protein METZ01_LOCUS173143 [marine metagenome]|uniref:Uncharacterized protein n=1 Tax=marine metagenome TaxID=408172 RepID=A0A382C370_9ZZZZ
MKKAFKILLASSLDFRLSMYGINHAPSITPIKGSSSFKNSIIYLISHNFEIRGAGMWAKIRAK